MIFKGNSFSFNYSLHDGDTTIATGTFKGFSGSKLVIDFPDKTVRLDSKNGLGNKWHIFENEYFKGELKLAISKTLLHLKSDFVDGDEDYEIKTKGFWSPKFIVFKNDLKIVVIQRSNLWSFSKPKYRIDFIEYGLNEYDYLDLLMYVMAAIQIQRKRKSHS